MAANETIWAFDLGKGSIGEAVREGNKFLHKASLLIPADFAETKTASGRRRMWRTRQAHKAREAWLDEVMRAADIPVLHGRRVTRNEATKKWDVTLGDPRLEREFPADGDSTCYTSCLLRIKLLRGEKLEPWQIYKALHSAIQRRGYDPDIPWKTRALRKTEKPDDDEAGTEARMQEFERHLEEMAPGKKEFQWPSYFDAWKMGLWNPAQPSELKMRIDCHAKSTRDQIVPRKMVEKELRALIEAAAKFHPRLNEKADYLIHGPSGKAYASYFSDERKKHHLREGGANDWQGVLGQKIPRFDNRILNSCALIPRLHVCRNPSREGYKDLSDDKLLPAQVTFLMKLKNMRVEQKMPRKQSGLTSAQIKEIFDEYNPKRKYHLTTPQWKKWCEKFDVIPITDAGEKGKETTDEAVGKKKKQETNAIEAPTDGGRSRFSRPALRILEALILSGAKPSAMHKKLVERHPALLEQIGMGILDEPPIKEKTDATGNVVRNYVEQPRPWLLTSDLSFLLAMRKTGAKDDSWEDLFIPNQRLDQVVQEISTARQSGDAQAEQKRRDKAIQELIGSQNDPKVRHRLATFWERLQLLEEAHGEPSQVVLEFIREDFMGDKAKKKLKEFQDKRAADRKKAREYGGLKFELFEAQGGVCLYGKQIMKDGKCFALESGLPLPNTPGWDELVIDHIVPREAPYNGPDSMVNYVLTTPEANSAKRKRTPFDWFHQDRLEQWDCYKNFVTSKIGALGGKKVQILTRADAAELVTKYTSLAETAWISKLAQTLIRLHFGWPLEHERGKERVTVVPGGLTGRIRRKYLLNTLLDERFKNLPTNQIESQNEEEAEKDRTDNRHHALDAMLISFFPDWMRNPKKDDFFRFPSPLDKPFPAKRNKHAVREYFRQLLDEVLPEHIFLEKAKLAETAYGSSFQPEEISASGDAVKYKTTKIPLVDMAYLKAKGGAAAYDYKQVCRAVNGIVDPDIRKQVSEFLKSRPLETDWQAFCNAFESEAKKDKGTKSTKVEVRIVAEIRTHRVSVKQMAYEKGNSREYDVEYARGNVAEIVEDSPEQAFIKAKLHDFFAGNPTEKQWKAFYESLKPIDRCKLKSEPDETGKKTKARTVKFLVFAHRPIQMKFNLDKVHARIDKICDEYTRRRLRAFVNQTLQPDQTDWNSFCESFVQERRDENGNLLKDSAGNVIYGVRIKKVRVIDGGPGEFKDFSKDGTGTFYKNKKEHKGQFVLVVDDGTPNGKVIVRPVYVFESVRKVQNEVKAADKLKRIVGYFQSGCTVETDQPLPAGDYGFVVLNEEKKKRVKDATLPLAPGKFLLKTIITKSRTVEMETATGIVINSSLDSLIKAGLKRVLRSRKAS